MEFLIATNNPGKIIELSELLKDLPFQLKGLRDFQHIIKVKETGKTFAENAVLKASLYALQSNTWSLSDDSGLEIEALNGAPGVYSARYGGADLPQNEKNAKLLADLSAINVDSRRARFVCAMAIADQTGKIIFSAEGICDGKIAEIERGTNGFGYDPIFIPNGFDQTFGELSNEIKGEISHRARAISKIIRFLQDFRLNQLDQ
jgi:XTP/dITP diphosphohydrolase